MVKRLRVAGLYIGIGFMLIEAGSILLPLYGYGDDVFRVWVFVVVIGFPCALVASWFFEITASGILTDEEAQEQRAQLLEGDGVAQVDPVDLQPVAPEGEVVLGGVAAGGVAGEAGEDDHPAARAEEEDRRLVADLDPRPGDQGHAPGQEAIFRGVRHGMGSDRFGGRANETAPARRRPGDPPGARTTVRGP